MKLSSAAIDVDPGIAELFERDFARWLAEATGRRDSAALEASWRNAVSTPVLELLRREGKHLRGGLVQSAWRLAGGSAEGPPDLLVVLVEVLHAGSLVVDDVQDGALERRGGPALHRIFGMPLAINTGNLLYAWALDLVGRLPLPAGVQLDAYRRTSAMMLGCHHGQALDLTVGAGALRREDARDVILSLTERKAGALMSYAAALGGCAVPGAPEQVEALEELGRELGVALQKLDDLSSLVRPERRAKAAEDLRNERATWAWAWLAQAAGAGEYARIQSLQRAVAQGAAPEPLAAALAERVQPVAREEIRRDLRGALARVRARFGDAPALVELEADLSRLETVYG